MSYDVRVRMPGGGFAWLRMSGRRPAPCVKCGATSSRLCDWKLSPSVPRTHRARTCSAPICEACSYQPATDKDLCPAHADQWRQRLERQKTQT